MSYQAIETSYRGYRFRSRTEARWAVFLDALSVRWQYEKEGFDLDGRRYLPDFWLPMPDKKYPQAGYWLEIKGQEPSRQEISNLIHLSKFTKHTSFLAVGLPGDGLIHHSHHKIGYEIMRAPFFKFGMSDEWWGILCFCTRFPYSRGELENAIEAARSARFEHGENG